MMFAGGVLVGITFSALAFTLVNEIGNRLRQRANDRWCDKHGEPRWDVKCT